MDKLVVFDLKIFWYDIFYVIDLVEKYSLILFLFFYYILVIGVYTSVRGFRILDLFYICIWFFLC